MQRAPSWFEHSDRMRSRDGGEFFEELVDRIPSSDKVDQCLDGHTRACKHQRSTEAISGRGDQWFRQ